MVNANDSYPQTLIELVRLRAEQAAQAPAFREETANGWVTHSNAAFWRDVCRLACALRQLGVRPGDRVALMAAPCYGWEVCDKAIMYLGAVSVGLDARASAADTEQVLAQVQARGLCTDGLDGPSPEAAPRFSAQRLARFDFVAMLSPSAVPAPAPLVFLQDLLARGEAELAAHPAPPSPVTPETLGALVFTSGTTGTPKGIPMTHRQLTACLPALDVALKAEQAPDLATLSWVPMHNATGRAMGTCNFYFGCAQSFVRDPYTLFEKIQQLAPTHVVLMPRLLQKAHAVVQAQLRQRSWLARWLFHQGMRWRQHGMPAWLARRFDDKIRTPLRHKLWGPNMRFMLCGSAPIELHILQFFSRLGVPIYEVYGMSEVPLPITMNRPGSVCLGSVGRPLDGQDIRIAPDDEVLLRSPHAMRRYWTPAQDEDKAGDAHAPDPALYTDDGYFRTGDLGAWRDGHLYLTGRKKEIIKTSTGQCVAPTAIEARLDGLPGVDKFVVVGHGRRFLCALASPDDTTPAAPDLHARIAAHLAACNKHLAAAQQVRAFAVLPRPLSVEGGEITSLLKLRRQAIEDLHRSLIDSLYQNPPD